MSVVDGGSASGLVQRVQDILLRPRPTWDVIDGETPTVRSLYTGYICILAALPPLAGLIKSLALAPLMGAYAPFTMVGSIVFAAVQYGLALLGVYIFAVIVDGLAPSFDGTRSQIQAFKGVTYGATAAWVGQALIFVPFAGLLLAIAGSLYTLYLYYLGLPKMMKVPEQRALGFVIVAIVIAIIIQSVIAWFAGMIVLVAGFGAAGGLSLLH